MLVYIDDREDEELNDGEYGYDYGDEEETYDYDYDSQNKTYDYDETQSGYFD